MRQNVLQWKKFRSLLLVVVAVVAVISARGDDQEQQAPWRIHTLFSVECQNYFDWQTLGLVHSFKKARQPGPITRLLSCTDEQRRNYRGMHLAPTLEVPSMSRHPRTGDWYPAINKPAGIVHWLSHSKDAANVDWVVILDADMIIRGPIIPWELGAEKGKPVAAYYGYLVGCDNILSRLHTKHPELCDKVGGLLAMHIDDLRALAPVWLSKTEEVREDRAHWGTNITGDIYGQGWISEMYGYSFGAAEVGLRHKITEDLMLYPGYTPRRGTEPILLHYGLPFSVGNWSFSKSDHHEDDIVYQCNHLFPPPPFPREVQLMETDSDKIRGLFLSIECVNTLNEGLLLHHKSVGCPKPLWSKYLSFLKSKTFSELTKPKYLTRDSQTENTDKQTTTNEQEMSRPKIHTVFSTECSPYFDWQTVGVMHSFRLSGQPGNITRLLSCTDEDLEQYKGHDLAPTHYVPSMSRHPLTGDWYPAINKPAAVLHWLNHAEIDAEFIVILDADMILRRPITPWEFKAKRGHPVSTPYEYLIGCDNELAEIHTRNPGSCDKVGGVIIMHIDDLRKFSLLWLHKTEEVRADKAHYATNFTGDIYGSGWISEMYGYSFGAAEHIMHIGISLGSAPVRVKMNLRHVIRSDILIYPGYIPEPGVEPRVFHYGLEFGVGNWSFDKANWRNTDIVNTCWAKFPEPPDPSTIVSTDVSTVRRDQLSIECMKTLNEALYLHHKKRNCSGLSAGTNSNEMIKRYIPLPRFSGRTDGSLHTIQKLTPPDFTSHPSLLDKKDEVFSSLKLWMVGLWALSVLGFLAVISLAFSSRKGDVLRNKIYRTKRRSSSAIFSDKNTNSLQFRD